MFGNALIRYVPNWFSKYFGVLLTVSETLLIDGQHLKVGSKVKGVSEHGNFIKKIIFTGVD